jgi:peptidoglycan-associated lipoprotein
MFMFSKRKITVICLAASIALLADGCKKKVPAPPPPPPAPAPAPAPPAPVAPAVAQFIVEPTTIQRGQSATLRWEVTGEATNVSINQGIGTVRSTGSQQVTPTSSTTYTLTAAGPGGTVTASATLTVVTPPPPAPPPPPPPAPAPRQTIEERISSETQDAYFDYDKSDIRSDARDALTHDAAALKSILADFPNAVITVEGHCDERGSAEYNIGLGDRRSSSAKDFLVSLGVSADRLKTVSYGKERPQCTESNETCWQKNRRAHLSVGQ